jgi:hypothetical protein
VVLSFNVTVVSLGPTATPSATATPPLPTPTATASPTPLAVSPVATPTPIGASPPSPTATATPNLINLPASPVETPTIALTAAPPEPPAPAGGAVTPGIINLIEPQQNAVVPAGPNQLDFKWQWRAGQGCGSLPDGYGFELRVWPAVTGYGPLGVMDAVANQKDIGCDFKTGLYNYTILDLKGAPGIKAMEGAGKFLWDVAYIQLQPYTVIVTSPPGLFELAGN